MEKVPGDKANRTSAEAGAETLSPLEVNWALFLLTLIYFVNLTDRLVLSVLIEDIKAEFGMSDTQLGLISGLSFALFYAACGVPIARLADRMSRVRLLSACLALWSVMTAMTGLAQNFAQLFLARMGVGVGEAGCAPAGYSLIGDYFSPERRAIAISIFNAGAQAGMAVGLMFASYVAATYGWRAALLAVGLPGIPLAILAVWTMRDPPRSAGVTALAASERALTAIAALARRRTFRLLLTGMGLVAVANLGMSQWVTAFFIRTHGMTVGEAGPAVALAFGAGGVAGTVVGGWTTSVLLRRDLRWEQWLPAIVYTLGGLFYAAVFFLESTAAALTIMFPAAFFVGAGAGGSLSSVQSVSDAGRRATAMALVVVVTSVFGLGLGSLAIGSASDLLSKSAGQDSLRLALLIPVASLLFAGVAFYRASAFSAADRADLASAI